MDKKMYIRPKTKRRLLVLLGVVSAAVGLLFWAVVATSHRDTIANEALRVQAMAAYNTGDFATAVTLLEDYRDRTASQHSSFWAVMIDEVSRSIYRDKTAGPAGAIEVEFAFGQSCSLIPLPARQHDAIHTFEHYLQALKPGDVPAQHELLKLYVGNRYYVEAVHLADEILGKNPRDGDALQQKVLALFFQHKLDLALAMSRQLNEIEPLNLQGQINTLSFMKQAKASNDELIAHAEKLREAHDKDPRFEMLLGLAYELAKQDEPAIKWLRSAAARNPTDAEFVALLARQLDIAGLYPEAAAYLSRAADFVLDPAVQYLLAQRLWQDGKFNVLLERFKQRDSKIPASDVPLLSSYRALALFDASRAVEARALVDALAQRKDPRSAAWGIGLSAVLAQRPLSPTELVTRLGQAVGRDPQNPTLHALLANAYLSTGETELAVGQCDQATQLSPGWAAPFTIAARAMLATHRTLDAISRAEEANNRAPGNYDTQAMLAKARFAAAHDSGVVSQYVSLLPLLEQIQTTWHDADTLPMYVTALAKSGKPEKAVSVVKAALAVDPPLSTEVLITLADVADAEKLGVGRDIRDFAQKARGLTPDVALAQARTLLEQGKPQEGLKLLIDASKGHEAEIPWRIKVADYREMFSPGEALKDWIALGDQYPGDLRVQQAILQAPSRANDRVFWARTIDRLKALTGEQGLPWRIERSRWLLSGDMNERRASEAEAINLLTQVTRAAPQLAEPHLLLAQALEKVNMVRGAIDELRAGAQARPGDPAISRELIRLLVADKRNADAVECLEKLAQNPHLDQRDRQWLVRMCVELDAADKAIAVLEKADDAGIEHDLMLAHLYRHAGRGAEAAQLYKNLLGQPIMEPAFWVEGANFLASQHDLAAAGQFLARLGELPLKPGELEIDLGLFDENWKTADEAQKQYDQAVKIAPQSAAAWQALAAFHFRHLRFTEAAFAAGEGLKTTPGDAPLKAMHAHAAALAALGDVAEFSPLLEALWRNPQDAGATEMLAAVALARGSKPVELAQKIREVADRHPDNLFLQSQAVQSLVRAGRNDAAVEIALRTAAANPHTARPQQLLATLYTNSGDWANAEKAALLWRQYSIDQPMQADLALARIDLQQPKKDLTGAIRALTPYVSGASPSQSPEALYLYAKALILADRAAEAAGLLKPLLADSAEWRSTWLALAGLQKDAVASAAWIGQVTPLISQDAPGERFDLANAWYAVGVRFNASDALEAAGQVLEPLLTDSRSSAQIWLLAGQLDVARSNFPAAEMAYRQAMKVDPQSADAQNNLAYVLWEHGRDQDLAEARQLAEAAIAARPRDAKYYDTLARIQERAGDQKGAIQNFRNAMTRDPRSLEAMIGLANLLSRERPTRQEARDLILKIQQLLDLNPNIPAVVRKQYQVTREALATSLE